MIAASPNGRVRLGPTILRLAASVRTDFNSLARPFLVKLSGELRETVDLATVKRDHLVFIDQVIGSQRLRTVSAVGETFPLYCTANGKAYLAQLDDRAIERLIGRSYEARTPRTLTRLDASDRRSQAGAQDRCGLSIARSIRSGSVRPASRFAMSWAISSSSRCRRPPSALPSSGR